MEILGLGTIRTVILSALLFGSAFPLALAQTFQCPDIEGHAEDPSYPLRKLAFEQMAGGEAEHARALFRCAITKNKEDRIALSQLVYLDLQAGEKDRAIQDIEQLKALHSMTKDLEMQLGYLYEEKKQLSLSRRAFQRAIEYNDPETTKKARKALDVIVSEWPQYGASVSLNSVYLSRFDDGIFDLEGQTYYRLGWSSPVSFYAHTRLMRDTASHLGQLPQIYSDNAVLLGGGLHFQPYKAHYFVTAEANEAYLFPENGSGKSAWVPDYRVVAGYFRNWPEKGKPLVLEANGSVGFYSRYQNNGIAYLQPREILNMGHIAGAAISGYLQQNIALDTNQEFYNNTAELASGIELRTKWKSAASLRAEYVRGYYLDIPARTANPYGSQYNDFRLRLLFGEKVNAGAK